MTQMVARLDDELASAVDDLVRRGVVASRSEAIRVGLERLIDGDRRRRIGEQIAAGYVAAPQTDADSGWADVATVRMIAEEPW